MTMIETNIENQTERMLPPVASGVEAGVEMLAQPHVETTAEIGAGITALSQVELPGEVHKLVVEDVNPNEHIRASLKDRFMSRFIKRKMGQIEKDLNEEHMELAEKQKVRPSLLHRELKDLSRQPEQPDPFEQRLAKANKMLANPQVSGAKKSVKAQAGPFRMDR